MEILAPIDLSVCDKHFEIGFFRPAQAPFCVTTEFYSSYISQ